MHRAPVAGSSTLVPISIWIILCGILWSWSWVLVQSSIEHTVHGHDVLNNPPTPHPHFPVVFLTNDPSGTPAIYMSNLNTQTHGHQGSIEAPATLNSSSFKTRCILQNHAEEATTPRVAEFSINGRLLAIGYESGFLEVCLVVLAPSTVLSTFSLFYKDTGNFRRVEADTMVHYRSQGYFSSLAPRVFQDLVRLLRKR